MAGHSQITIVAIKFFGTVDLINSNYILLDPEEVVSLELCALVIWDNNFEKQKLYTRYIDIQLQLRPENFDMRSVLPAAPAF